MTFAISANDDISTIVDSINYLLSNLGQANSLITNTATGQIVNPVTGEVVAYLYQYINIRYATSSNGLQGFSSNPAGATYYGIQNTTTDTPRSPDVPQNYQWYQATPPFGVSNYLFYSTIGGRQILWYVGTASPGSTWLQVVDNTAINLDAITGSSSTNQLVGYARIAGSPTPTGVQLTVSSEALPTQLQSATVWGLNTQWYFNDPNPASPDSLYITNGTYYINTNSTIWNTPYRAQFNVTQLSQITPNAGVLTSGTIGGNITISTTGNVTGNRVTANSVVINSSGNAVSITTATNANTFRGIRQDRSRGTLAAPTAVTSGDQIAVYNSGGYTTFNQYQQGGGISVRVAGVPASNTAYLPSNVAIFSSSCSNTQPSIVLDYTGNTRFPGNVTATANIYTVGITSNGVANFSGQTTIANLQTTVTPETDNTVGNVVTLVVNGVAYSLLAK